MDHLKSIWSLVLAMALAVPLEARSCLAPCCPPSTPLVQVALLLDTSNSMDGLIEQAKSQLWRIANDLAYSTRCGERPRLEIALYEYGNNGLSAGENFIRQVLPFTTDMDLISEKLFGLRTHGGYEYCGAVIKDAVQNLRWSRRDDVYKTLFIAGNEPFTQGAVYFRDAVAQAVRKDIRVNAIFCGAYAEGVQTQWQEGAMAGRGAYLTIDHHRAVVIDPTPYDDEISRLGYQLNQTYVAYGSRGRAALADGAVADRRAARLPAASGAVMERAALKASPMYSGAEWDVVSAVARGQQKVSELKKEDLPAELKEKTNADLEAYLQNQHQTRASLQARLGELRKQRDEFLVKKQSAKGPSSSMSLDQAMRKAIREQAGRLEFKFEGGK